MASSGFLSFVVLMTFLLLSRVQLRVASILRRSFVAAISASRSSAQPGGKRCFTPVGNEVVARAQAVVDEVEGLVVKDSIIRDDIVLRQTSKESREDGNLGRGDDDDTSGERDVID